MGTDQPEQSDLVASTSPRVVPEPDESARLDAELMAELSNANAQLARYVLRFLDADARRAEPVPISEEFRLASCLSVASKAIHARAELRKALSAADEPTNGEPR
jgi:hypothetical protein